jgi:hypothetical protein
VNSSSNNNKNKDDSFQNLAKKIQRTIDQLATGRRTSFDTLDLSVVSTAAPSTVNTKNGTKIQLMVKEMEQSMKMKQYEFTIVPK